MQREKSAPINEAGTPETSSEYWPIPAEWRWARVSDLGAVKLGRQLAASKRRASKATPYLRAANIGPNVLDLANVLKMDLTERERESLKLIRGDVVLSEASGSPDQVGKSAVWNEEIAECCFQNTVIRFRPHALLPAYAQIVFRHFFAAGVFARASHGVGIQHLGASRFAQLQVPVPGEAEQARIVEAVNSRLEHVASASVSLGSALRGINQQVTTIIEAAATGQHNAFGGTAATKAPAGDKRPKTTIAALAQVEIPSSWKWVKVSDVGEVKLGRQRTPRHERGTNIVPYLRVANVFEDQIDTADVLSMNFTPEEQEIYRLKEGDILLNEGQSEELVGRPAMYRGDPSSVCFQNTLVRFRSARDINPEFALFVFRFYLRSGVFRAIAKTSTNIAHLGAQRFAELPFPLPDREEQEQLVLHAKNRLRQLETQRATVLGSGTHIEELRKETLAAAVRGELTQREATEETAADMLIRLGPPPKEITPPRPPRQKSETHGNEEAEDDHQSLTESLVENGGRMTAEDLFANARYKKDQIREFATYYLALRDQMGKTIRMAGSVGENSILEVIPQ